MRRRLSLVVGLSVLIFAGLIALHGHSAPREPAGSSPPAEIKTPSALPVSQVVLFNSGVAYFQREGDIDGTSRVDLTFPIGDINDLLKSLIIQDTGGGRVGAVRYDSPDPIERSLRSLSLDLSENPTLGELLNMARGERIELSLQASAATQPASITGVILGMEETPGNGSQAVRQLNVLCAEGVRGVPLNQVQRVRFLNPVVESELRRALELLVSGRDMQKRGVSLVMTGSGKRRVRVGYVTENPIWKTSYRLMVSKEGKIFLQGWANLENTTDEDWNDVRLALVSGRPLSFQMDLYQPLFVPRPVAEPERFASLRPLVYNGPIRTEDALGWRPNGGNAGAVGGGLGGLAGLGGLGGGLAGLGGGGLGGNPMVPQTKPTNREKAFKRIGRPQIPNQNRGNDDDVNDMDESSGRLTYKEWLNRKKQLELDKKEAGKLNNALTRLDPTEGVASLATAQEVGNAYQWLIDQKVTLPRQKSVLLPVLDQSIEGERVSLYNEAVQARFPLLGLRFKNGDKPLPEGPVTIYDDGVYAGDARVRDLQPKEGALISFAVDQGVEVKSEEKTYPDPMRLTFQYTLDKLFVDYKMRQAKTYWIRNRTPHERTVVIEHPVRKDWKLVEPARPREEAREEYRFDVKAPAGGLVRFEVIEENDRSESFVREISSTSEHFLFTIPKFDVDVHLINKNQPWDLKAVKVDNGLLDLSYRRREFPTYSITNRLDRERTFTVNHPVSEDWKVLTRDVKRETQKSIAAFTVTAAAGQTVERVIEQESDQHIHRLLWTTDDTLLRYLLDNPMASVTIKALLQKVMNYRSRIENAAKDRERFTAQLKAIGEDQTRIRTNIDKVPKESDAFKRYLKKFDAQETEIEKLQEQLKTAKAQEDAVTKEYEAFLKQASAQ